MKSRCLVISEDQVKIAFNLLTGMYEKRVHKQTVVRHICSLLNITPGELKTNYQDVFLKMNMLNLGWVYDDITETYYKLYEEFNESAKQVLRGLKAAGYSRVSVDKAKIIINNIFGGKLTSASIGASDVYLCNKDKGIKLSIRRCDLR